MAFDLNDEELKATREMNGTDIATSDYVRTDKGIITKAGGDIFTERLINGKSAFGKMINHNKDIVHLIKKGDYVNGMYVINTLFIKDNFTETSFVLVNRDEKCTLPPIRIPRNEIKTIVTKEQFNSIMYTLEE